MKEKERERERERESERERERERDSREVRCGLLHNLRDIGNTR